MFLIYEKAVQCVRKRLMVGEIFVNSMTDLVIIVMVDLLSAVRHNAMTVFVMCVAAVLVRRFVHYADALRKRFYSNAVLNEAVLNNTLSKIFEVGYSF